MSATGTLSAVTTINVGTQVSGQLADVLVDFNDRVKKGQLLARIDPKLAQQAVTDAEASLDRSRAQLLAAQREHSRNRELLSSGLVARSSFDTTESAYAVAVANVKSSQVALDRARQNLEYTSIYAPIDGVVVERNVDLGQTVAASLSAPQLFLIANDLSRMQILVKVDESDIGSIKQGQPVKFTVQALPRETFRGSVKQVRLQSAVQENVVQYTVVIEVDNREMKLLPGMTASVDFLVQSAKNVLTVSNAALRFSPQSTRSNASPPRRERGSRDSRSLYVLAERNELQAIPVRVGITDGRVTAVSGESIREGMRVVSGSTQAGSTEAPSAQSPFPSQQREAGPRRGGF